MKAQQFVHGLAIFGCTVLATFLVIVEIKVNLADRQLNFGPPQAALAWGSGLTTLCQNLELYYKFDEVTGSDLIDTSDYTRSGSLVALDNSNRYTNVPSAITFLNSGSLQLTGGGYAQTLTGSAFSLTGDISVATWVRPNGSFSGKENIFLSYGGAAETEANNVLYELLMQTGGTLELRWESGAGTDTSVSATSTVATASGTWAHAVATRNNISKEVTFYWNGSQVGTAVSYGSAPSGGASSLLFIGTNAEFVGGATGLEGQLDDLRIYSTVLSSSQVSSLYTTGDSYLGCTCGDSILQSPEQCDNGTANSDVTANACRTTCRSASCGDGVADSGEECDGGGETSSCNSDCTTASCGDGTLNTTAGEECDNGGSNSNSTANACRTNCKAASCGDGVVDSGEQCDDGNEINTDTCTNSCKNPACGDGYVQISNNETCEPPDTETCASNCTGVTSGGTSNSDDRGVLVQDNDEYETRPPPPEGCGNRVIQPELGEECDEGVRNDVGACSYECKILYCGDGIVSSAIAEQCEPEKIGEDANGFPVFAAPTCTPTGQTCSVPEVDRATGFVRGGCRFIFINACEETPIDSTTEPVDTGGVAYCGNGILEAEEACDQGGICQGGEYDGQGWNDNGNVQTCMAGGGMPLPVGGDGCSATCQLEACGDGIVQAKGVDGIGGNADDEQCDNGRVCVNDPTQSCNSDEECSFRMFCQGSPSGQNTCGGTVDGDSCKSDFDCIFFSQCVYNDVRDPSCSVECKRDTSPVQTTSTGFPNDRQLTFNLTADEQISNPFAAQVICGQTIELAARVISTQPDPSPSNNLTTQTLTIQCDDSEAVPIVGKADGAMPIVQSNAPGAADVAVDLFSPKVVNPGQQFTATVRVRNFGPNLLEIPARLLFPVPAGLQINDQILPGGCQVIEAMVECNGLTMGVFNPGLVQPVCGNYQLEPTEACDDGNLLPGDGCSTTCTTETAEPATETEVVVTDEATEEAASCGNGLIEAGETCDDGERNSDTQPNACRTDCSYPTCGDSVIDVGEQCDAGAGNSDTEPDTCRTTCQLPHCGDGLKDSGEQCDGTIGCLPSCTYDQAVSCGDGLRQATEECDDGNTVNGDGCSEVCKEEPKLAQLAVCGNGNLETGEKCDDGNLESNDGCSANCMVEKVEPVKPVERLPVVDSVYDYELQNVPQSPLTAQIIPLTPQYTPIGDTGPGALVFLAGGATFGFLRRRQRST